MEEAYFVAKRRGEPRLTTEAEVTNARRVMAERAVWMVTGVVLNWFIFRFLLEPCWVVAALNHHLINQASAYGHVFGGLCLLLELAVARFSGLCFGAL